MLYVVHAVSGARRAHAGIPVEPLYLTQSSMRMSRDRLRILRQIRRLGDNRGTQSRASRKIDVGLLIAGFFHRCQMERGNVLVRPSMA